MRWFISLRYFLSHKRQSLVCIAGVTISVAMFITMTAMMNGFTDKFIIETVESSGHIAIKDEPRETKTKILEQAYKDPNAVLVVQGVKPRDKSKKSKNSTGLILTLKRMPGITGVAPMVTGPAITTYGTKHMNLDVWASILKRKSKSPPSATKSSAADSTASNPPPTASSSAAASPTFSAPTSTTVSCSPPLKAAKPSPASSASSRPASPRRLFPRLHAHQRCPNPAQQKEHHQRNRPPHRRLHQGQRIC
jgi:hypothetical protein